VAARAQRSAHSLRPLVRCLPPPLSPRCGADTLSVPSASRRPARASRSVWCLCGHCRRCTAPCWCI
jgi:hypothetical protein